jgi:hypothetical protein
MLLEFSEAVSSVVRVSCMFPECLKSTIRLDGSVGFVGRLRLSEINFDINALKCLLVVRIRVKSSKIGPLSILSAVDRLLEFRGCGVRPPMFQIGCRK